LFRVLIRGRRKEKVFHFPKGKRKGGWERKSDRLLISKDRKNVRRRIRVLEVEWGEEVPPPQK